jgi:hypothetical protein
MSLATLKYWKMQLAVSLLIMIASVGGCIALPEPTPGGGLSVMQKILFLVWACAGVWSLVARLMIWFHES